MRFKIHSLRINNNTIFLFAIYSFLYNSLILICSDILGEKNNFILNVVELFDYVRDDWIL